MMFATIFCSPCLDSFGGVELHGKRQCVNRHHMGYFRPSSDWDPWPVWIDVGFNSSAPYGLSHWDLRMPTYLQGD